MTDPLISEQVLISIFLPSIFKVDHTKDSICKTWDSYAPIIANNEEVQQVTLEHFLLNREYNLWQILLIYFP